MSRFFGGKGKEKDKSQKFYVEFLGWIESRGLMGEKYTRPVVDDLRRKHQKWRNAPKLTVQVSKSELKVSQDVPDKNKKKPKTTKFPVIPVEDVTYVSQARHPVTGQPDDTVACIYLGYIPRTKRSVHVHVYRFDSAQTASKYVRILQGVIGMSEDRLKQIEFTLIARGELEAPINTTYVYRPRPSPRDAGIGSSDGMSEPRTDSAPDSAAASTCSTNSFPSDEIEPDLVSLHEQMPFESVTDELKLKLNVSIKEGKPLLLPPKDYDTIRRKQGNLENVENRRCLNASIVGNMPWSSPRSRNVSDESGIGLESPSPSEEQKKFPDSDFDEDRENSPPSSARSFREEFVYPPQSARSPKITTDRQALLRQPSFSSAYSSQSYRSGSSSSSFIEKDNSTVYTGKRAEFDIPPADYDADDVAVMREKMTRRAPDMTSSMPVSMFPRDMPEYAIIDKKRTTSTNTPPQFSEIYSPRGVEHRVRRVNSMYK
ncbi:uncharacterized protein LOC134275299 [Saccostrea cucullata]|uniref:uncharacterized protein LOC134275299 n=1 Tax=Saccostrea cuccullata TaxID=36930 RepID=UPI002ED5ECF3